MFTHIGMKVGCSVFINGDAEGFYSLLSFTFQSFENFRHLTATRAEAPNDIVLCAHLISSSQTGSSQPTWTQSPARLRAVHCRGQREATWRHARTSSGSGWALFCRTHLGGVGNDWSDTTWHPSGAKVCVAQAISFVTTMPLGPTKNAAPSGT